jgi:hypothetical protein
LELVLVLDPVLGLALDPEPVRDLDPATALVMALAQEQAAQSLRAAEYHLELVLVLDPVLGLALALVTELDHRKDFRRQLSMFRFR